MVIGVIQARMSSNRLRGKTLMPVAGVPLLRRVVENTRRHTFIDRIIVATSSLPADDPIEAYCHYLDIECMRGHPIRVYDRYSEIAQKMTKSDTIARITADNCFSRTEINECIYSDHIKYNLDYSFVKGLSHVVYEFVNAGVFSRVLENKVELNDYELEHVTPFFRKKELPFKIREYEPTDLGLENSLDSLLTLDTDMDLRRIESLLGTLKSSSWSFNQIYSWLNNHADFLNKIS
jgi:spore coat polysaccharide biosynthesis protein SpsF (cytidylyltransferase family)